MAAITSRLSDMLSDILFTSVHITEVAQLAGVSSRYVS
ncbi:hypothetical protein I540_0838 [Mycobacteroides abscessus subsp. bolletii 1513]|uniref:Uncharacterized protein n=1 Tax=Mycobacteroides abscessus subsp. bolletii 1513 TaxID=1299321 RepID=X8DZH6_9MYCO|nr:hypothetical protein I540_0838 [Mycobacteroides abscessus subsp. bolletii 1513]